jgi:hypothetical protein
MKWWQWVLLGIGIWCVAIGFIIAFLKGADWGDDQ